MTAERAVTAETPRNHEPVEGAEPAEVVERFERNEPPVTDESAPFWEATREGRLLVQWCTSCDRGIFFPRVLCPCCGASNGGADHAGSLVWREASGRATVYAAVVEHRPEAAGAVFAHGEPYCIALVDLEEGARMMTNVVGCPPADVHSGMPVTVSWEPLSDGRQLALFRPAGPEAENGARP
jgi:uncharacterized protein